MCIGVDARYMSNHLLGLGMNEPKKENCLFFGVVVLFDVVIVENYCLEDNNIQPIELMSFSSNFSNTSRNYTRDSVANSNKFNFGQINPLTCNLNDPDPDTLEVLSNVMCYLMISACETYTYLI